jgi:hypothetical protein
MKTVTKKSHKALLKLERMFDQEANGSEAEQAWTRVMAAEELVPMYKAVVAPRLEHLSPGEISFGSPEVDEEGAIECCEWTTSRSYAERRMYVEGDFQYKLLLRLDRDSEKFDRQFEYVCADEMGLGYYMFEALVDDEGEFDATEGGLRALRYTHVDYISGETLALDIG